MLCRALSDTSVAGHPEEYFLTGPSEAFPPGWRFWEEGPIALMHGVKNREAYLDRVYRIGASGNGVFGAKVMWGYLDLALEKFQGISAFAGLSRTEVLRSAFPGLQAIQLLRRDRLRQAVSWLRASQDGIWVVSAMEPAQPTGEPHYDRRIIAGMQDLIEEGERGWRQLFAEMEITPCVLYYEDLLTKEGYESSLRMALSHLGLPNAAPLPEPRTLQQSDDLNDDWVERFLAESSSRTS